MSDQPKSTLIGVCQNPHGAAMWFPIDRPGESCAVMGCGCKPLVYVLAEPTVEPPQGVVNACRNEAHDAIKRCITIDADTGDESIDWDQAADILADDVLGVAWRAFSTQHDQGGNNGRP